VVNYKKLNTTHKKDDLIYPLGLYQISQDNFYIDMPQCLPSQRKMIYNITLDRERNIEKDLLDKTDIESDCLRYRQQNHDFGM